MGERNSDQRQVASKLSAPHGTPDGPEARTFEANGPDQGPETRRFGHDPEVDEADASLPWGPIANAASAFEERYSSKDILGRGGMGEVQLLRDRSIGREVAAKFLDTTLAAKAHVRARFMREACLQGRLEHPSIVPVHDVGVTPDGRPFFTMKRVRGMTLREVLEGLRAGDPAIAARFSRRKLLSAFSNLCLTIAFAHEQGVLHRDLKPANIMLGDFGETYVLDWGIAKLVAKQDDVSNDMPADSLLDRGLHGFFGTPGYMAPEQATGAGAALTYAADVYALGAVLFEILTLEPLHPGKKPQDLIRSTLTGTNARASERAPDRDVPPELEAICIKACSLAPESRYQSVREMNDALERFLDGDRDLALRRDLANTQIEMAEEAQAEAHRAEPEVEAQYRSLAISSLGRALALDSDNARAMKRLVNLLLERPRFVPAEVEEAVAETLKKSQSVASKSIALTCMALLLGLPVLLTMNIQEWWSFISVAVGVAVVLGLQVWVTLRPDAPSWVPYVNAAVAFGAIAVASRMFGPLILGPSLITAYMIPLSTHPSRNLRKYTFGLALVAVVVPCLLEAAGLVSPAYVFADGDMKILHRMMQLPPGMSQMVLLELNVALICIVGFGVNRFRHVIQVTEERAQLYAWQLRQLLPRDRSSSLPVAP